MKSSLVILPACLLALAHLISAQTISTNMPPTDCEQVQNLSPECATALAQARTGSDQTESFCSGDCFGTVLSAYQSCGSGAAVVVQGLQEGEISCHIKLIRLLQLATRLSCSSKFIIVLLILILCKMCQYV